MITDINSEDRLVQQTFAEHLRDKLGWESLYAWDRETFGAAGLLGRTSEREVVLVRDLRHALGEHRRKVVQRDDVVDALVQGGARTSPPATPSCMPASTSWQCPYRG